MYSVLMNARSLLISALFVAVATVATAQRTLVYDNPDMQFRTGIELFEKEKYASAQAAFKDIINSRASSDLLESDAFYYSAICAASLLNKDAEYQLITFVKKYPENPKVNRAYFELGRIYYRHKRYKDAI